MSCTNFMIMVPLLLMPSGARKPTVPPTLVLTDTSWSGWVALLRMSR